jgi:hypothetical protein
VIALVPEAVAGLGNAGAFGVFTQCDFEEGFGREETDECGTGI